MTILSLAVSLGLVCFVLAVILLAARDRRQHRLHQEQRPLEDRIADIRADAAFMANQLEGVLDRRNVEAGDTVAWIAPVVVYYRRLEELAADSDASAEEIQRLADESAIHVRQQRLKGVFVAQQAELLAVLVRRRQAG
jgi:hypothetical protein